MWDNHQRKQNFGDERREIPLLLLARWTSYDGERAEDAIIREIKEELEINASIIRPLWLNQAFFTEDVDELHYHELCIYFLMNIEGTSISQMGNKFTLHEGNHTHDFEWLEFEELKDLYFYPLFLKDEIFNLPETFTIRTEIE